MAFNSFFLPFPVSGIRRTGRISLSAQLPRRSSSRALSVRLLSLLSLPLYLPALRPHTNCRISLHSLFRSCTSRFLSPVPASDFRNLRRIFPHSPFRSCTSRSPSPALAPASASRNPDRISRHSLYRSCTSRSPSRASASASAFRNPGRIFRHSLYHSCTSRSPSLPLSPSSPSRNAHRTLPNSPLRSCISTSLPFQEVPGIPSSVLRLSLDHSLCIPSLPLRVPRSYPDPPPWQKRIKAYSYHRPFHSSSTYPDIPEISCSRKNCSP